MTYYVQIVDHLYPLINVILTYYKVRTITLPVLQKRLFSLLDMIHLQMVEAGYRFKLFFISFYFIEAYLILKKYVILFIEVQLIYNVVLISTTQQNDLVMHIQAYSFSYSFPL